MARAPPEKPEASSLRTKIVLSFWAAIVLVGLPTWHYTTSISRASLPLDDMLSTNTVPSVPLPIWVLANRHFSCQELDRIANKTQAAFDSKNTFFKTLNPVLRIVHDDASARCGDSVDDLSEIDPAMVLQLELTKQDYSLQLVPGTDVAVVQVPANVPDTLPRHLADTIYAFFLPEQVVHALQLKSQSIEDPKIQDFLNTQPPPILKDLERQLTRATKASPAYHLTFSLFTASGAPSSWGVQQALDAHIRPLVTALALTSDIHIATQVQLYSAYSPSIRPFEDADGFHIDQNDLAAFVNAAEWPLSPSIGSGPTLNFVIYVPSREQIPLKIDEGAVNGWLIPQWGAITILNPTLVPDAVNGQPTIPSHLSAEDLRPAFESFSSQLLSLLGVLEFEGHHSLPLRLRAHKRLMGLALSAKASSGLGSLARLAKRLHTIPIPKHVAQLVANSMSNLTAFTTASRESRWNEAIEHASDAYMDSEKAFFDKSMVGQVYFPDEHKVAVYLPLLGPIGVPLLMGLIREVKRFTSARMGKATTA